MDAIICKLGVYVRNKFSEIVLAMGQWSAPGHLYFK